MPNLMDFLRMKNIFGPQEIGNDLPSQGGIFGNMQRPPKDPYSNVSYGVPDIPNPADMPPQQVDPAFMSAYDRYKPETAASDRYNQLITDTPRMQDYKPSVMRRIGGALTAVGQSMGPKGFQPNPHAMEAGMELMNRPFNEKLTDWKNQIVPAQNAANLERQNNINERQLAYGIGSQQLTSERLAETERHSKETEAATRDRNSVYRLKETMPDYKFDFSGPTVKVANEATGQVQDTGVSTGHFSESEKMELQQKNKLAVVKAQGANAETVANIRADTAEAKGWQIFQQDGKTYRINPQTNMAEPVPIAEGLLTKPGTPGKGATKQPENIKYIQQRATDTIAAIDELLQKDDKGSLVKDKDGNFTLNPDYSWATGASRMAGTQNVPLFGKTYEANVKINYLKANMVLDLITELKSQSKTGATGFGSLAVKELNVLEQAASKLDPASPSFVKELKVIRDKMELILRPEDSQNPTQTQATPTNKTPDDYWNDFLKLNGENK